MPLARAQGPPKAGCPMRVTASAASVQRKGFLKCSSVLDFQFWGSTMIELRNLRIVEEKLLEPCMLNQLQTAERLEISERYLRELDEISPPRA